MHCGVSFCGSFTAELTGNRFNIPASNRINRRLKRPQSEAGGVTRSTYHKEHPNNEEA